MFLIDVFIGHPIFYGKIHGFLYVPVDFRLNQSSDGSVLEWRFDPGMLRHTMRYQRGQYHGKLGSVSQTHRSVELQDSMKARAAARETRP